MMGFRRSNFEHFVKYIECGGEILALGLHCDESIEDGSGGGMKVVLGERGIELAAVDDRFK